MANMEHSAEMQKAVLPPWARIVGIVTLVGFIYALLSDGSFFSWLTGISRPIMLWSFGLTQGAIMIWQWFRLRPLITVEQTKRRKKDGFRIFLWIFVSVVVLVALSLIGLEVFGDTRANRQTASVFIHGGTIAIAVVTVACVIWRGVRDFAEQSREYGQL